MIEALGGAEPMWPSGSHGERLRLQEDDGRREYVAHRSMAPQGPPTPKEGAGILTSLTETDRSGRAAEGFDRLEPGTEVDFVPYSELI